MPVLSAEFLVALSIGAGVLISVFVGARASREAAVGCFLAAGGLTLLAARVLASPQPEPDAGLTVPHGMEAVEFVGVLIAVAGVAILTRVAIRERRSVMLESTLAGATAELQATRGLLDSVLRSAPGATLVLREVAGQSSQRRLEIRIVNGEVEQLFGVSKQRMYGKTLEQVAPKHLREWLSTAASDVKRSGLPYRAERRCEAHTRTEWFELAVVPHGDGVTMTVADVTNQKRIEDALRRAAYTDPLTGLANRAMVKKALADAVHRARRNQDYGFTLMFLDFDRFKQINDSLGHEVGDELLKSIAGRLNAELRRLEPPPAGYPEHLSCRLGGDEFVLLLSGIFDENEAAGVADSLVESFGDPHELSGNSVVSTASVGVVVCDGQYMAASDALRDADCAMYEAKTGGKARYVMFTEAMRVLEADTAQFEADLRTAVERQNLRAAFQPVVNLWTGQIEGFEALARWDHPSRGAVEPETFIRMAEKLGIIRRLGELMLYRACEAIKALNEVSIGRPVSVHVNHSKLELLDASFVGLVQRVLDQTGADPQRLKIEITESVCVAHQEQIVPVLCRLRELGVRIAIDDFGTGDSSFMALDQFPIDELKIDRRFLQSEREVRSRAAILRAMVDLAHHLDIPVVVEGIETVEDLILLQSLECDHGQGWLLGDSMPLDEAERAVAMGYAQWVQDGTLIEKLRVDRNVAEHFARAIGARAA